MELKVNGQVIETTEQGFLCVPSDWHKEVAVELARRENIHLSAEHWEIINFIRTFYRDYEYLPNARGFSKAIKNSLGNEQGTSRYLQKLFPNGPLKYACKIAGLPKPPSCL